MIFRNYVIAQLISREFLTGFRKRKLERKKKAQEELQKLLKEERKRIKQEVCTYIDFVIMDTTGLRCQVGCTLQYNFTKVT